jgi:hypothetical protein
MSSLVIIKRKGSGAAIAIFFFNKSYGATVEIGDQHSVGLYFLVFKMATTSLSAVRLRVIAHPDYKSLPRALQWHIHNPESVLCTMEFILAVEYYLKYLYPVGFCLDDDPRRVSIEAHRVVQFSG